MGATLCHLWIHNYNLTQKEYYWIHESMDYAVTNPFNRAANSQSKHAIIDTLAEFAKEFPVDTNPPNWDIENDRIIQVITIPMVMGSVGYYLSDQPFDPNAEHTVRVVIDTPQSDLDEVRIANLTVIENDTVTETFSTSDFRYLNELLSAFQDALKQIDQDGDDAGGGEEEGINETGRLLN